MRRLNHLFRRSSRISYEIRHGVLRRPLIQELVLDAFPTELFIHIATFVEERRDLCTLCLVSKTFRDICVPLLYRRVHIGGWRQYRAETYFGIYQALQRPSIACVVVVLHIKLDYRLCEIQDPIQIPKGHKSPRPRRCTCMSHDSLLGDAIPSLQNLQILTILCTLCSQSHGHEYLFKLDLPALRQFTLHCYESAGFGKDTDSRSVLQAPFMSRITVLSLECEQTKRRSRWNSLDEQLLRETNTLSHLDTIVHNGSPFFDCLLSHRRIRRLCFPDREIGPYAIRKSPNRLTHLFSSVLIFWLLRDMKLGIEPYIHLRVIGTVEGIYRDVGPSQLRFHEKS